MSDADNTPPKRPVAERRDQAVKASIWRNEAQDNAFHPTTFSRTYEDKDGNLRDAHSFSGTDLLKVSELSRWAYHKSQELDREERRAAFDKTREERPNDKSKGRDR